MALKNSFRFEVLQADIALVLFLLGMRGHVVAPVTRSAELFVTSRHRTGKRALVGVRPHVDGEIALLQERLRALGTRIATVCKMVPEMGDG